MEKTNDYYNNIIQNIGYKLKESSYILAHTSHQKRQNILHSIHDILHHRQNEVLTENQKDVAYAHTKNLHDSMMDRLIINPHRVVSMLEAIQQIIAQPDPLGIILDEWNNNRNGLFFQKKSVPLGVLGVIYESRPNVFLDASCLALKSGNAILLRGGSESFHTSVILCDIVQQALEKNALPTHTVQLVPTRDRQAVHAMLRASNYIDVLIPRGGKNLIHVVREQATMPVFSHLDGNCHLYIDQYATPTMVHDIVINAKLRRVSICGALESLVIHKDYGKEAICNLLHLLHDKGVDIKGDEQACAIDSRVTLADESDYFTEYLAPILSIKIVDSLEHAIAHINHYSSHHTDGIITDHEQNAHYFLHHINSAIVMHNTSTQFADGGEFGFGGEIGIATGKLHARGPVGAQHLTTFHYHVHGKGTLRP